MYQTLMKDLEATMQPVFNLADIQRHMLERITSIRTECIGDCISAGVKQYEALSDVSSPMLATEMQLKFMQDFSAKMMNTAEQNMSALTEAGESINQLMDESLKSLSLKNPLQEYFDLEVTFFTPGTAAVSKTESAPVAAVPSRVAKPAPAKKTPVKKAAIKKEPAKKAAPKTTTTKPKAASKPPATVRKTTRAKAPAASKAPTQSTTSPASSPAAKATPKAATTKPAATKPAATTSKTASPEKPAS